MKIYLTHSTNFDFQKELYEPLMNSELYKTNEITLPHIDNKFVNSKAIIQDTDLVLAEVSYPSTGQGIELGWAESFGKKVICFYRKGSKFSSSLKTVSDTFLEYENADDMINKLTNNIK